MAHKRPKAWDKERDDEPIPEAISTEWLRGPICQRTCGGSFGRYTGDALEQTPKGCGILVADLPADLVYGQVGLFKPALRLIDADLLNVADGGKPRGTLETASRRRAVKVPTCTSFR